MYICPLSLLTKTRTTAMSHKPVIAITADHMMIRNLMPAATAYDVYIDIDAGIPILDAKIWAVFGAACRGIP